MGSVLQKLIYNFEKMNEKEPEEEEQEEELPPEGTVVEKDESEINDAASTAKDFGNRPPVERS